jgi:hypothetical protein
MTQDRAILAICPCECECGNKWTEQELIIQVDKGYNYDVNYTRYEDIFHKRIIVEGVRMHPSRKAPVCYRCVTAPQSQFGWKDHPKDIDYYDPQTAAHRAAWEEPKGPRRTRLNKLSESERAEAAQKTINQLLDLD